MPNTERVLDAKGLEVDSLTELIHLNVMQFTSKLIIDNKQKRANLFIKAQEPSNRAIVECAMLIAEGNQSKAARLLGLSRSTIRQYLFKYFGRLDIGVSLSVESDIKTSEKIKTTKKVANIKKVKKIK